MNAPAYTGEIRLFAGNYAPEGWLLCNGTMLSISDNEALFALIGTTYGGDGRVSFAVPDLRGRVALAMNTNSPDQPVYPLGVQGGLEGVKLTGSNIPSHTHNFGVSTAQATSLAPTPNNAMAIGASSSVPLNLYTTTQKMVTPGALGSQAIGNSGSSTVYPHDNVMPSLVLTYIICSQGEFPSSN